MANKSMLDNLWDAMASLYEARYKAADSDGPAGGRAYPQMDYQTFSDIATLQTDLQSLISRLEKEKGNDNFCSTEDLNDCLFNLEDFKTPEDIVHDDVFLREMERL
jgi:hypothetical protein